MSTMTLVTGLGGAGRASTMADALLARWGREERGEFGDLEVLVSARAAALAVAGAGGRKAELGMVGELWLRRQARAVGERRAFLAVADAASSLAPDTPGGVKAIRRRLAEIWDEEASARVAVPDAIGEGQASAYQRLVSRLADVPAEGALDLVLALAAEHPELASRLSEIRTMLQLATAGGEDVSVGKAVHAVADDLACERQIRAGARARILDLDMVGPGDVAVRLGAKRTNREKARLLRNESRLLGLPAGRARWVYPAFQIDARRTRIHPVVERVNRLLGAASDPWGVASWWSGRNVLLDGRPCDALGAGRDDDVWRAACALVEHDPAAPLPDAGDHPTHD